MRMLQTPSSCSESFILWITVFTELVRTNRLDRGRKTERIRFQRCIDKCEITRSETFGIFSRTCIWKQFAGKHSGLRITVRDNSTHNGLRTRIVLAQGISWYELQNSTWRGRRFWADHFIMPRVLAFSSKSTIRSLCSNSWRNNYFWPVIEVQIVKILDQCGLESAIPSPNGSRRTSYVLTSRGKSRSVMPNSDPVQNYSLNFRSRRRRILLGTVEDQHPGDLCGHPQRFSQPTVFFFFSHKEPFLRPRGSGKLFPPILRMEELCHWRSPKWLQEWCVTTTKMNDNLTQHFTGTRQGWYCWKRSQNMEHKMLRLFMREAARQGSRTARTPKIPWPTSEQFKDTLVEEQLTLSWLGTFWFLTVGKSIFFAGVVLSAFNLSLRTDWFRVERKATKGRQTVFFTPLNPSGGDSDEEEPRDDYTVPQKVQYHSHCWIKLSWAQDQGLQFWQTKSHAIIAHGPVPTDLHLLISKTEIEYCSKDSQTLDSTPRPAPKVSLKSNWHSQQQ